MLDNVPYVNIDLEEITCQERHRTTHRHRIRDRHADTGRYLAVPARRVQRHTQTRSRDHPLLLPNSNNTRLDRANLLAAARATIAAHHDGEPDPLAYLRDELNVQPPTLAADT